MFSSAEQLRKIFSDFEKLKVLIAGDVMIDRYLKGKVDRISPEAPVPVVSLLHKDDLLGGAANVALNIKSLGAEAILCSVIGDDPEGATFLELLEKSGISNKHIIRDPSRVTTTKSRIIGNKMQMLRVDHETLQDINSETERKLMDAIRRQVSSNKPDVIIFQDYNKGVLTSQVIEDIIQLAGAMNIPVVADPKRKNFNLYHSIRLFKPNLKEIREGLKIDIDPKSKEELDAAALELHSSQKVEIVMITLSEDGVFVSIQKENKRASVILNAHVRNIADVSGAGDTVISVAALCTAAGLDIASMAALSNLAGGLVCERSGVVPVDKQDLIQEATTLLVR